MISIISDKRQHDRRTHAWRAPFVVSERTFTRALWPLLLVMLACAGVGLLAAAHVF